jgi:hypothetical protein
MRVGGCCRRRRYWNEEAVWIIIMRHSQWWRWRPAIYQAASERPIVRASESIGFLDTHAIISQKILHGSEFYKLGGLVALAIWGVTLSFAAAADVYRVLRRRRESQGTIGIFRGLYVTERCRSRRREPYGINKIP